MVEVFNKKKRTTFSEPNWFFCTFCQMQVHHTIAQDETRQRCNYCLQEHLTNVYEVLDEQINILKIPDLHKLVMTYVGLTKAYTTKHTKKKSSL